jgi:AraC-like DNA-binding protein
VEYINGLRCRHALELLREKNTTITDIALASGFDSTRTFYRAFQRCFGCTPNESLML